MCAASLGWSAHGNRVTLLYSTVKPWSQRPKSSIPRLAGAVAFFLEQPSLTSRPCTDDCCRCLVDQLAERTAGCTALRRGKKVCGDGVALHRRPRRDGHVGRTLRRQGRSFPTLFLAPSDDVEREAAWLACAWSQPSFSATRSFPCSHQTTRRFLTKSSTEFRASSSSHTYWILSIFLLDSLCFIFALWSSGTDTEQPGVAKRSPRFRGPVSQLPRLWG